MTRIQYEPPLLLMVIINRINGDHQSHYAVIINRIMQY